MYRISVGSSDLESVGYDAATDTLEIRFHSNTVYRYLGVPSLVYQGLMAALSKGRYFHANIEGHYPCQRIF